MAMALGVVILYGGDIGIGRPEKASGSLTCALFGCGKLKKTWMRSCKGGEMALVVMECGDDNGGRRPEKASGSLTCALVGCGNLKKL